MTKSDLIPELIQQASSKAASWAVQGKRGKWREGGGDVKVKDTLGACVDTLLEVTIAWRLLLCEVTQQRRRSGAFDSQIQ